MKDLKLKSELYRLDLSCGYLTKKDVINWADNEIRASENPDISIIELALLGSKTVEDIISKLKEVRGHIYEEVAPKILLGLFYREVIKDSCNIQNISTSLYDLYRCIEVEDKNSYEWMNYLDDEFYLACNNIYGEVEEVKCRYIDYLKQYENYAIGISL